MLMQSTISTSQHIGLPAGQSDMLFSGTLNEPRIGYILY